MKHPLFNTIDYSDSYKDPVGGTLMGLYYISDMKPVKEGNRRRVQMCDCGFRATNSNSSISNWNQCQYEDIDYKNWIHYWRDYMKDESKIIDCNTIYVNVVNYIIKHWPHNLYYYEVSRHGEGFHFIFYFDIERNIDNWKKTKIISHSIINQAFIRCGYENIINFDGKDENGNQVINKVFDSCTDRWNQLLYLTLNKGHLNSLCTGEVIEYDDLEVIDYKPTKVKYVNNGDDYIINVEKHELENGVYVDYIDHFQRWHLYNSLRRCYGDDFEDEWSYCCEHIPIGPNDHSTEWYKERSEGSSWDKDYQDNSYIDKDIMKMFGYTVTFTPKTKKKGKNDFINILGLNI